jgi:hypothetical protein
MLIRGYVGIAALYCLLRSLADWRAMRKSWAMFGLVVAIAGLSLTFMRLPLLEAHIEIQDN